MGDHSRFLLKFAVKRALQLNPVTAPYAAAITAVGSIAADYMDREPSDHDKIEAQDELIRQLLDENFDLRVRLGELDNET